MAFGSRARIPAAALTIATAAASGCGGGQQDCTVTDTCPNQRPAATIVQPANGASFVEGAQVGFQGSATDPEDGALTGAALTWRSSLDGQIGTGLTFARTDLSPGTHTIRLIARDSEGAEDTASISITIEANAPPEVAITEPPAGGSAQAGALVQFSGSATDAEDGTLTGSALVWTSSLDEQIGTGVSFSRSDLSVGTHTITLTATDSGDRTGSASIQFTITPPTGDPTVTIDQPAEGPNGEPAAFGTGENVTFQATADDAEDGPLTGGSLAWTSNVDGQIGTGVSFSTTTLSEGMHTVVVTATDSDTNTAEDTVLVNVNPPSDPGAFDILLRLSEGVTLTAGQRTVLENARTRWQAIIAADLLDAAVQQQTAFTCGGARVPPIDETVDDLIIYIEFEEIDGPGGVLGSAGPCLVRDFDPFFTLQPGDLPLLGGMRFDSADLQALEAQGRLEAVIVHEMGHVLGFGTLWGAYGQVQDPTNTMPPPACGSQPDTHYTGAEAIAAMQALETASGTTYTQGERVPAENNICVFGAGSLDTHWRESVFDAELMTPALDVGANPLSTLTIESMEDLGYAVDPSQADAYAPVFLLVSGQATALVLEDDIAYGPLWAVTPDGRVHRVR